MDDQLSILNTSDGSNSLSSIKYNATYHSIHGAIEESMHVFISAGLYYKVRQGHTSVKIFEMGFGTGLNAYLTSLACKKHNVKVEYHSIELHLVQKEIYEQLNFHTLIPNSKQEDFLKIHEIEWNKLIEVNPNFSIKKIHADLNDTILDYNFDLIFYDAFAPSSQAELWEENIHNKLYNSLTQKGALVTYCAQGKFKRMLKGLGYSLDKLPGPGRKHEMTRAIKT